MQFFDVVIIGAGAAGLFCAGQAGQRGLKVLVLDHSEKVAEKIRISGGGRCNFTNRDFDMGAPQHHYVGKNPFFCRSALARYAPEHFIALVEQHGIAWHEKHKGQLFCDDSAEAIIAMLLAECAKGQVERWQPCKVKSIRYASQGKAGSYCIQTQLGEVTARSVVIATGGLSIPQTGATDFGHRIARQFGIPVVEPRPGLVPLIFEENYSHLAGMSLPVHIGTEYKIRNKTGIRGFHEDLLFTHRGLSGPAILQISNYWQPGQSILIDYAPGVSLPAMLLEASLLHPKKQLANVLASVIPARLAETICARQPEWQHPIGEIAPEHLRNLSIWLIARMFPVGTEGWKKAEVTIGGIDTSALSQQSMECKKQPGLYFIGEVVDITGWLGGYNFQWAWASAHACAQALPAA